MALGGQLTINVNVTGAEQLAKLKEHTTALNAALRDTKNIKSTAIAQTKNEIAQLQVNNRLLASKAKGQQGNISRLAREMNKNEDLNKSVQNRLAVEQGAWRLKKKATTDGINMSIKEARIVSASNIQQAAAIKQAEIAIKAKRRAMMQVSISMFVMAISVNQFITSLKPLVKGNEEAAKALEGYSAVLNLSLAPMQAYMSLKMIQINLEKQHAAAVMGVVAGMSAAYFWYAALTSKGRELRIVMGALAGALTAVAIIQGWIAVTAWQAAIAKAAESGVASLGATVPITSGIIAGGIVAASGIGALIGGLTAPKAQTLTGQGKYVREGGLAKLDPGEIVTRPSGGGVGTGGGNIFHLHFPPGTQTTNAQARQFGKIFAKQQNMGMGRRTSRSVLTNG